MFVDYYLSKRDFLIKYHATDRIRTCMHMCRKRDHSLINYLYNRPIFAVMNGPYFLQTGKINASPPLLTIMSQFVYILERLNCTYSEEKPVIYT